VGWGESPGRPGTPGSYPDGGPRDAASTQPRPGPAVTAGPVRVTAAGSWFRPPDGGAGSLLRLADGIPGESVRKVRDVGVPGLLPIGNVVERDGVWLRTPQPPGPALEDLLTRENLLGVDDAIAVLGTVGRILRSVHARGLAHGRLDGSAVMLDPDGVPLLVMVEPGRSDAQRDAADLAALASALAQTWCDGDPAGTALLRRCAVQAATAGIDAALAALPRPPARPGPVRRQVARAWALSTPGTPGPTAAVPRPRAPTVERRSSTP
jgi:hypothetical protein